MKILLKNDNNKFYYSGFDSKVAKTILPLDLRLEPQTVALFHMGNLFYKSRAIFKIIGRLRFPWPLLVVLNILPTSFNDRLYDWVARNRISWFGRPESCYLPTPAQESRFFD